MLSDFVRPLPWGGLVDKIDFGSHKDFLEKHIIKNHVYVNMIQVKQRAVYDADEHVELEEFNNLTSYLMVNKKESFWMLIGKNYDIQCNYIATDYSKWTQIHT